MNFLKIYSFIFYKLFAIEIENSSSLALSKEWIWRRDKVQRSPVNLDRLPDCPRIEPHGKLMFKEKIPVEIGFSLIIGGAGWAASASKEGAVRVSAR